MTCNDDRSWNLEQLSGESGLTAEMDSLIHQALSVIGALKADVARQGPSEALKTCASQLYELAEQITSVTEEANKQLQSVPASRTKERQLLEASWKFHFNVVRRIIEEINSQIRTNINIKIEENVVIN